MAKLVLGMGSSHTPMISMPPEFWGLHGERQDKHLRELISPRSCKVVSYEELLAEADPAIAPTLTLEHFTKQYNQLQRGVAELSKTLRAANPDTVIIVSDDQDELFFEDNMPAFMVYWGESIKLLPWPFPETLAPAIKVAVGGYGDVEMDVPVNAKLGQHLIEFMMDADFDVSHSRYFKEAYGGEIGPAGYVWWKRETKPRPHGMGHGYAYVVKRIMENKPTTILPVGINTCYPPNQPTPKRCYEFGKAIRAAVEAWDSNERVAIIASGGLSHFVLDEEIDQQLIRGMREKNGEILCSMPRERLNSASSEIRNWIAVSAACEHLDFDLVEYVPVNRTPAGTGGGWGFARWT